MLHMWAQADRNDMVLKPITEYGWSLQSDELHITWDTDENMTKVQERLNVLLKGCKCSTGCKSRLCGCRKKVTKCSEGCQCTNCENTDSPSCDREGLAEITLEEEAENNTAVYEDEEFAKFVFAAAFDHTNEQPEH